MLSTYKDKKPASYIHTSNIIITYSERALFDLNARAEAQGKIVPKAVGRAMRVDMVHNSPRVKSPQKNEI